MSKYVTFHCLVMFVAPFIFHQGAGETLLEDRNRVLFTFEFKNDQCSKLPPRPKLEIKQAADLACKMAFDALDRLESNSCSGCRYPECRKLTGVEHPQCSCTTSICTKNGMKSKQAYSFRYCSHTFYNKVIESGKIPAPSKNFERRHQKIWDEAVQRSWSRRVESIPHGEGTSSVRKVPRSGGSSRGNGSMEGGSSSQSLQVLAAEIASHSAGAPDSSNLNTTPVRSPGMYVCRVCGHEYTTRRSLHDHVKTHVNHFRCDPCNSTFSNKGNYNSHNRKYHSKKAKADAVAEHERRIREKRFACDICTARFSAATRLTEHMAYHRGETQCTHCGKTFPRKAAMNLHIKNDHPGVEE